MSTPFELEIVKRDDNVTLKSPTTTAEPPSKPKMRKATIRYTPECDNVVETILRLHDGMRKQGRNPKFLVIDSRLYAMLVVFMTHGSGSALLKAMGVYPNDVLGMTIVCVDPQRSNELPAELALVESADCMLLRNDRMKQDDHEQNRAVFLTPPEFYIENGYWEVPK